jgi:DNA-binding transcriptional LysR family regulator
MTITVKDRVLSEFNLRTFIKIVDAGGIAEAAPDDYLMQANYSRYVRELEDYWGFRLTREYRGQVVISRKGRELAAMAKKRMNKY